MDKHTSGLVKQLADALKGLWDVQAAEWNGRAEKPTMTQKLDAMQAALVALRAVGVEVK